jgi:predicted amidohydrolase
LAGLAAELKIHLVAGMMEADAAHYYNSAVLLGPDGKLLGKYRKQKLDHESVRNTAGHSSDVFATSRGRVGLMICADRRDADIVRRYRERGADFLICPSGGMFGPERNDPIVQARSREIGKYIVFVHPAEFLVTAPDGSIAARKLLGDRLLVAPQEIGTHVDQNEVVYFELPIAVQPTISSVQ